MIINPVVFLSPLGEEDRPHECDFISSYHYSLNLNYRHEHFNMLNLIYCPGPIACITGKALAGSLGIRHVRCLIFGGSILHARTPTPDFDPTRGNNNPTKALFSTTPHQQHHNHRRYSSSVNARQHPLSNMAATKEYRLFCLENPLLGKCLTAVTSAKDDVLKPRLLHVLTAPLSLRHPSLRQ